MSGRKAERIELGLDAGAAALFASAVAFAAMKLVQPLSFVAAAAGLGFFGTLAVLRKVAAQDSGFRIPDFVVEYSVPEELDEPLLTDTDRLMPPLSVPLDDELVLNDILAKLGEDSRVVRLFDPSAMPTPSQLKARIDRHLGEAPGHQDDSQALHEALAQLRNSLR